jgi:hypothetical protein
MSCALSERSSTKGSIACVLPLPALAVSVDPRYTSLPIRIESHDSLAKQNGGKNVCYRRSIDVPPRRNDLRNNRGCSRRHALYPGLGHKWKNGGPHVYR